MTPRRLAVLRFLASRGDKTSTDFEVMESDEWKGLLIKSSSEAAAITKVKATMRALDEAGWINTWHAIAGSQRIRLSAISNAGQLQLLWAKEASR